MGWAVGLQSYILRFDTFLMSHGHTSSSEHRPTVIIEGLVSVFKDSKERQRVTWP